MRILSLSDVHGRMEMLRKVREVVSSEPGMIVFTGDIVKGKARGDEWLEAKAQGRNPDPCKKAIEFEAEEDRSLYEEFFGIVREWDVPVFLVPGNMDAPKQRYFKAVLRDAAGCDKIRCVHGLPGRCGDFVVSGMGGEITEDTSEDFFVLQIPRWETEFSLQFLRDLPERKILLFHSPPVGLLDLDEGNHKGSRVVNSIIKQYEPWLAFCGHAHNSRGKEAIAKSFVVNPGALKAGHYALIDSETREAEFFNVAG